jgi:restriction system protein
VPPDISPADFEKLVHDWLRLAAGNLHQQITMQHLGVTHGEGGEYRIDVLATFSVFSGAEFMVLVECKHQKRPVERDDVMVLESKLRDVHAQKAMLFSTSGFQSGALEFACAKHVATIAVVEGRWLYETRASGDAPSEPPPWVHFDAYAGIRMTKTTAGVSCHTIDMQRPEAIEEWVAAETPGGPAQQQHAADGAARRR